MTRLTGLLTAVMLAALPLASKAAEPIKIGMVVPLTGPIADAGRYGMQGAKLTQCGTSVEQRAGRQQIHPRASGGGQGRVEVARSVSGVPQQRGE